MRGSLEHKLGERVKELTALHRTARILQRVGRPTDELMNEVASLLPGAWQHPEAAAGRIRFGDRTWVTAGFRESPWGQTASFTVDGQAGGLDVVYLEERPPEDEGPFLHEERDLLESLADLLRSHFQQVLAGRKLQRAHDDLERQVRERTAALEDEAAGHRETARRLREHRAQLSRMASELCLAEARERRRIAVDLHDHVGQALAVIRNRVSEFQGNAVFCGFEDSLAEVLVLLDRTIRYTRDLTGVISPPILYELGLPEALDWLAERAEAAHGLKVAVDVPDHPLSLSEDHQVMFFESARELLRNVTRHAGTERARLTLTAGGGELRLVVADEGRGFDPAVRDAGDTFGLFSIRERMEQLGGRAEVDSAPGRGTRVTLTVPLAEEGDR